MSGSIKVKNIYKETSSVAERERLLFVEQGRPSTVVSGGHPYERSLRQDSDRLELRPSEE